jgi:hypothetical protein
MSLTANALNELELETRAKTLWREYLASYFNGAVHTVGDGSRVFPLATLKFDQSEPEAQPMNGVEIRMVLHRRKGWSGWAGGQADAADEQRRVECGVTWLHFIRARTSSGKTADANLLANQVADCLFAILNNRKATDVLAEKGIQTVRPEPAESASDNLHALRVLACNAHLVFTSDLS